MLNPRESHFSERARIRKSMRKWRKLDEPARLLGRGLGSKELTLRVARDVGASLRQVHGALKTAGERRRRLKQAGARA